MNRRLISLNFVWLLLVVASIASGQEDRPTQVFDIPSVFARPIESANLESFLPVSFFNLKKEMTREEIIQAFPNLKFQQVRSFPHIYGETPSEHYLERIDCFWEDDRLRNVSLSSVRLPPTQGQLKEWISEIGILTEAEPLAFHRFRYERAQTNTLILEWHREPHLLRLTLDQKDTTLFTNLDYYPGPGNPAVPRIRKTPVATISFEFVQSLLDYYIRENEVFPAGEGPRGPLPLPEGERQMLESFSKLRSKTDPNSRDGVQYWIPFEKELIKALNAHYAPLGKKGAFERLIDIARGKVPAIRTGSAQVGAAAFLAKSKNPDVIEYLFRGLEVELPSGVESHCAEGLARFCTGPVMDRVLLYLDDESESKRESAVNILSAIKTQAQLKELLGKARKQKPEVRSLLHVVVTQRIRELKRDSR
ncbi:hypothetical protein JIN78_01835 [Roseibacillus ishigakijimensis]|uniref:HEAT repeat domain-containing protein n=2 Tax=Roseibacillus ishigakijimensis TaxID=454146 RepID=A0A934VL26_9BACT|nr:hypothetical protein [Roseibacillus ishigakijimensis]MBK1832787.1 hypothetical protein [Roseibacillus ishigakijimensis]